MQATGAGVGMVKPTVPPPSPEGSTDGDDVGVGGAVVDGDVEYPPQPLNAAANAANMVI